MGDGGDVDGDEDDSGGDGNECGFPAVLWSPNEKPLVLRRVVTVLGLTHMMWS